MFCQQCACEFSGWVGKCPHCQNQLITAKSTNLDSDIAPDTFDHILRIAREHSGMLKIQLFTAEIVKKKRWSFPYLGYGYGWEKEIRGGLAGLEVVLRPVEVTFQREWRFLFRGYGFAWVKTFRGEIGGNPFLINATKVNRKMTWIFPYFGFGRAWVDEYIGTFGDSLKLEFVAKNVIKQRELRFPWRGYGYAWIQTGELGVTVE